MLRLVLPLAFLAAVSAQAAELPAGLDDGGMAQVQRIEGHELLLADGRRVHLVGVEFPHDRHRRGETPPEEAALKTLLGDGRIALRFAGSPADRHGRVLAHVVAGGVWVQGELLRRGLARVHGFADNRKALPEMLALEDAARRAGIGLWADPSFAVRRPEDARRDAGSFQLVEGTVFDVRSFEGDTYLHFGSDWHETLSLKLDREATRLCRQSGLDLKALAGTRIRVRGFIDGTSRPTMAVSFPEQIERL
jgi:micrococcal nuclease